MKTSGKDTKVTFLSSIKTKIILLVVFAIIGTLAINLWTMIPVISDEISTLNQNYMYDIAVSNGEIIQSAVAGASTDVALAPDYLKSQIGNVGIKGVTSSYAYVVAADGTMLYHPTAEKIGQSVENAVVSGLVQELANGKIPEAAVVDYVFKGAKKYAAYYVNPTGDFILVVSADETEVYEPIRRLITRSISGSVFALIVCALAGILVAYRIVKPINKLTVVINRIGELDFSASEDLSSLTVHKDEIGLISRSIANLRMQLVEVVLKIKERSKELYDASELLSRNTAESATTLEQVEKAVSEIADGATTQASETQKATENVILIGDMISETNSEVEGLASNSTEMKTSGDEATAILGELGAINKQTREAIDLIYDQTNVTNESAVKIREAVSLITSIAEETNLLSLNASIEAARAGEQGRGFAVVASQIQKLAEQSNESAKQIEQIINSLISDSEKAVTTMGEVKEIIAKQNKNVESTGEIFALVKGGIDTSLDSVNKITGGTKKMDEARINVVDVVQSLTAIAEENAASTEETSASVTEVSAIISEISDSTEQLKHIAEELDRNMDAFIV